MQLKWNADKSSHLFHHVHNIECMCSTASYGLCLNNTAQPILAGTVDSKEGPNKKGGSGPKVQITPVAAPKGNSMGPKRHAEAWTTHAATNVQQDQWGSQYTQPQMRNKINGAPNTNETGAAKVFAGLCGLLQGNLFLAGHLLGPFYILQTSNGDSNGFSVKVIGQPRSWSNWCSFYTTSDVVLWKLHAVVHAP